MRRVGLPINDWERLLYIFLDTAGRLSLNCQSEDQDHLACQEHWKTLQWRAMRKVPCLCPCHDWRYEEFPNWVWQKLGTITK